MDIRTMLYHQVQLKKIYTSNIIIYNTRVSRYEKKQKKQARDNALTKQKEDKNKLQKNKDITTTNANNKND